MEHRDLGRTGLRIAPLVFGGNVFGWTVPEPVGFRLLDQFVAAGYNMIDTADVYSAWVPGHSGGESEAMIGRWLKARGQRDDVLIATKVGMATAAGAKGLSPGHIRRSLAGSLARLGTDYVDLYQAHTDDPDTPIEATLRAFTELVDADQVRAVGASNYSAERFARALEVARDLGLPGFQSLQPRYNLLDRSEYEGQLAPLCGARSVGVLAYAALASGFLTGKYHSAADLSKSPRGSRIASRLDERGLRTVTALESIATELDSHAATVALAWLMSRPGVTAPIASATSSGQLSELLAAPSLRLAPEHVRALEGASALDTPPGAA